MSGADSEVAKVSDPRSSGDAARSLQASIRPARGHLFKLSSGAKLLPDTFSLLETVTSADRDLLKLRDQLWRMKRALINAGRHHGCSVSGRGLPDPLRVLGISV